MSLEQITNFRDSNGADLGTKLITKEYLISVYPEIAQQIGIPPELWVWGLGTYGKLGNGVTAGNISTPVTTSAGGTNWKSVSSGWFNTAAIKTDGTLWTWGNNISGQLGTNDTIDRSTPVTTFAGGTNWKQVALGNQHVAAIKTDGTLWTWGYGPSGQLGNASTTSRSTPVTTFAGGTNWKQVSCNGYFSTSPPLAAAGTAAIKTDGTLWIWGDGEFGQLGNANTANVSTPITTFAGGTNWKQVSCGSFHTSALKSDGTLWTCGRNNVGQLGNANTTNVSTPITTFAGGTNWKQVSSCFGHTTVIKTDGTLWVWGTGLFGRLGNAQTTDRSTPVTTFAGGNNWKQVSAGGAMTAAIKTDGTLWSWGYGQGGRLGNASTTNRSTPVTTFAGGTDWKQVSALSVHSTAIKSVDFAGF